MSLVTQTPTDPAISVALTDYVAGLASGLVTTLNARQGELELRDSKMTAWIEELHTTLGNGWISGGAISAGQGLAVTVGALSAMVGHIVEFDASQIVGLSASAVNYIFLREDGTWTVNTTGATPTDTTTHGISLLWGTATTDTSSVVTISNTRDIFGTNLASILIALNVNRKINALYRRLIEILGEEVIPEEIEDLIEEIYNEP